MSTTNPARLMPWMLLPLMLLAQGCSTLSRPPLPPPVVVECPRVPPLSEQARQIVPSQPPLQRATRNSAEWQQTLRKASGAASAAKPSTKQPKR